jgi:hypothetical protein
MSEDQQDTAILMHTFRVFAMIMDLSFLSEKELQEWGIIINMGLVCGTFSSCLALILTSTSRSPLVFTEIPSSDSRCND